MFFDVKNLDSIIKGPQGTVQNNRKGQFMTPLSMICGQLWMSAD